MKILTDPRSGSYQGITSSRNRFGQYVRTRAMPVQPRTTRQGQVRGLFGSTATQWRGLTDDQRAAWANMAANYNHSDSLGQSYTLTGSQFYQSAQLECQAAGNGVFGPDAPTSLASFVMDTGAYAVTADASLGEIKLAFSPTPIPSTTIIIIQSTGPVSPGLSSPPGTHYWRFIHALVPTGTSPQNFATQYTALFGTLVAGQKIFTRVKEYDELAARASSWTVLSTIVIA